MFKQTPWSCKTLTRPFRTTSSSNMHQLFGSRSWTADSGCYVAVISPKMHLWCDVMWFVKLHIVMHSSFSSKMQTWRPHHGHVDETSPVLQSTALFSQQDSDWFLDVPRNFRSCTLVNLWMKTILYYFGKKRIKDDDSTWVVLVNYIVTVDGACMSLALWATARLF